MNASVQSGITHHVAYASTTRGVSHSCSNRSNSSPVTLFAAVFLVSSTIIIILVVVIVIDEDDVDDFAVGRCRCLNNEACCTNNIGWSRWCWRRIDDSPPTSAKAAENLGTKAKRIGSSREDCIVIIVELIQFSMHQRVTSPASFNWKSSWSWWWLTFRDHTR